MRKRTVAKSVKPGVRMTRKRFLRTLALGGLGAAAVGWGAVPRIVPAAGAASGAPRRGGTVTLGTAQDFPGLDPMLTTLFNGNNLHTLLWNGLTRYNEMMEVQPDLAEKWEIPDPKTFVFHLRRGVKFHNGRDVTVDDVKASIDRTADPATKSPYQSFVGKVQTVEVVDKYTVKLNLNRPNVVQPEELVWVKIMPKDAVADAVKHPIGTGPFQLDEFVPGDHLTLKRFAGYWDRGKPYPDQFVIKIIKDDTALYTAFKAGQFDILWQLTTDKFKDLESSKDLWIVRPKISGNSMILQFDDSRAPWQSKLARKALLYATDKKSIFDLAYFSVGWLSPTNSTLPANHWAFNPNLKEYPYDLKMAKELFKEAGVKDGYTIRYNALSGLWKEWIIQGEILQRSLKEVGINLTIQPVDLSAWVALRAPGQHVANLLTPNGNERAWDPSQQLGGYTCNELRSRVYYCNRAVDALLAEGIAERDKERRKRIYWKVQETLWEEVPWITTHHRIVAHGAWNHIKGLYVDGQGNLHFDGLWTEK